MLTSRHPRMDCQSYRAELFRLHHPADRTRLEALLQTDPRIEIHDGFRSQVEELIETRNPSLKLSTAALAERVDQYLALAPSDELGSWVYYPWSHRLVHTFDEAEFAELRSNRNRYKLTLPEQQLLATKRIGVVGLSVGQSVSVTLAMERAFGQLRLADFDRLSLSNMNRIRTGIHNLDVPKTWITAREIAEIDPWLDVQCENTGLTEENLDDFFLAGGKLDLIVDECDDLMMKFMLRQYAMKHGIPVVMETSDRGMIDVERFDLEPGRPAFHGLAGEVDVPKLRGLSTEDKIPFIMRIIGQQTLSNRQIASMIEVGQSIKTWPQLASSVILGGGAAGDVIRRILLGQFTRSGRFFFDIETTVCDESALECDPWRGNSAADAKTTAADDTTDTLATLATLDTSPATQPWQDPIEQIVTAAACAPSGGNCQPWQWLAQQNKLWLIHDRKRANTLLDFEDGAAMVALGAACENAVLKAHQLGYKVHLSTFPATTPLPDCVALLELASGELNAQADLCAHEFDHLAPFIAERVTNRKPGTRMALPQTLQATLMQAVASVPGARLQLLQDAAQLEEIGAILGAGDRVRLLSQQLHAEMMGEMRWNASQTQQSRDGIDLDTLELSASDRAGINFFRSWPPMQLISSIGGGHGLAKMSRNAVAAASAVGLITLPTCARTDFFQGGRALQRLWLATTAAQWSLQPMSALTFLFARLIRANGLGLEPQYLAELHNLRARYLSLFEVEENHAEVLLFRLTFAEAPSARALRRQVDQILLPGQ